ncbi:aminodeoxychorismate/anthranilate synthase component II [Leucobacter sp. OH1287]|uniref:anthranilate synthase component II n=1 Tax=Leucobacter sp. OH1287 TaxID=2491049 RepID=UPI000F5D9CD5|nr:gamma-glutamyl-gamma-aminobutyrate hydrolase family protein [Leucobacter sp. OH1287]RRD60333.1 anthranilate synthase component II [Leucobacter sp. OH1287]
MTDSAETKILVIDNYDSFVYTLVSYLEQLGAKTTVIRNDAVAADPESLRRVLAEHDGVLVSPGPGNPSEAGVSIPVIRAAADIAKPMLGVCLGHQSLGEAYGATVTHAEELMHGKISHVKHTGDDFFHGVPERFTATRYHSLAVVSDTVPAELVVTAATESGIIMAMRHRDLPLYGVQYHPESVLTEFGYQQLGNWLELVGLTGASAKAAALTPIIED